MRLSTHSEIVRPWVQAPAPFKEKEFHSRVWIFFPQIQRPQKAAGNLLGSQARTANSPWVWKHISSQILQPSSPTGTVKICPRKSCAKGQETPALWRRRAVVALRSADSDSDLEQTVLFPSLPAAVGFYRQSPNCSRQNAQTQTLYVGLSYCAPPCWFLLGPRCGDAL